MRVCVCDGDLGARDCDPEARGRGGNVYPVFFAGAYNLIKVCHTHSVLCSCRRWLPINVTLYFAVCFISLSLSLSLSVCLVVRFDFLIIFVCVCVL